MTFWPTIRLAANGPPSTLGDRFSMTMRGALVAVRTADLRLRPASMIGGSRMKGMTRTSPGCSSSPASSASGAGRLAARSALISTTDPRFTSCSAVTRLPGLVRLRILSRHSSVGRSTRRLAEVISSWSEASASAQSSGPEKRTSSGRRDMNSKPIGTRRPSVVAAAT